MIVSDLRSFDSIWVHSMQSFKYRWNYILTRLVHWVITMTWQVATMLAVNWFQTICWPFLWFFCGIYSNSKYCIYFQPNIVTASLYSIGVLLKPTLISRMIHNITLSYSLSTVCSLHHKSALTSDILFLFQVSQQFETLNGTYFINDISSFKTAPFQPVSRRGALPAVIMT